MLEVLRYRQGRLERAHGVEEVKRPPADEHVWIRVEKPRPEELAALGAQLGLHELALEDALREGHPPKLEDFGDHLFFIVHSPEPGEESKTRKLAAFLGKNWVVSIVRAPIPCVDRVLNRVEHEPPYYFGAVERIAHALLDHTVDAFEARVDAVLDEAEVLEDRALDERSTEVLVDILQTRWEVSSLLRTVRGQRDVCGSLSRGPHAVLSKKIEPYFRDVYDHCLRIHDLLESAREAIGVSRDAYLSAQSNRLNETMRVLTVIATVMMPLGVVAGIFGMNFDAIPGLHSPLGFWLTMGFMGLCAAGMIVFFRRRGWV